MAYDSENIEDMISILKKSGYKYTSYNHKNGSCSINTNIQNMPKGVSIITI